MLRKLKRSRVLTVESMQRKDAEERVSLRGSPRVCVFVCSCVLCSRASASGCRCVVKRVYASEQ